MAIDPVTRKALRTPMFIVGAVMLVAGLVPFLLALLAGSKGIPGGILFWVFVPLGGLLMALARSRASREWRQER
jgi:hypothetical protein